MNIVVFRGHIGNDPQLNETKNGKSVCNFSVAHSFKYKTQDGEGATETTWLSWTAWGSNADFIYKHFNKGSEIELVGRLQEQKWTDKLTGEKRSKIIGIVQQAFFVGSKKDKEVEQEDEEFTMSFT